MLPWGHLDPPWFIRAYWVLLYGIWEEVGLLFSDIRSAVLGWGHSFGCPVLMGRGSRHSFSIHEQLVEHPAVTLHPVLQCLHGSAG